MIEISQAAAKEITRIKSTRNKSISQIRLTVKQGGCSGLFYNLSLEPQACELDYCFESNGISVLIDSQSYGYLNGVKLDYAEDLMGGGFRFQNPNAIDSCGCGISFKEKASN